jgi:penicillin-binding protein 1A
MNITPEEARSTLYNNGLRIYTTMDSRAQKIVETEYDNPANFPGVTNLRKDGAGNIIKSTGGIILYAYPNYFDENGTFTLFPEEFQ